MTIVSHKHKFIFVRPMKVASSSILVSLWPLCGREAEGDVFCIRADRAVYRQDRDDDYFDAVEVRNNDIFADLTINEGRNNGHIAPEIIRKKVGDRIWCEYFKFTVIRNPWDWFISFLYWRQWHSRLKGQIRTGRVAAPKTPVYYALRHWRQTLNRYRAGHTIGKESVERALRRKGVVADMARWPRFYFLDGRPYADCYLRFEHLQEDFDRVCQQLGLPAGDLPRTKSRVRPKGIDYRDYYTDWSRDYIGRRFREIVDTFGYSF